MDTLEPRERDMFAPLESFERMELEELRESQRELERALYELRGGDPTTLVQMAATEILENRKRRRHWAALRAAAFETVATSSPDYVAIRVAAYHLISKHPDGLP